MSSAQQSPSSSSHETEEADYAAASYSTANYAQHALKTVPTKRRRGRWMIALLVLIVITAVYWFGFRSTPKASAPQPSHSQQSQAAKGIIATKTQSYSSTEFTGLSFNYPTDWTLTETAGSGALTVVSPMIHLNDATGQTTSVAAVFAIRNKQQPLPEFDGGNAVAARVSEKITYTQPSSTQRGSTYISFLEYAKTVTNGIDGIYITGDTGYQLGQAIPKADLTPVDPVVSLTFAKCSSAPCSAKDQHVTLASTDWNAKNLAQPLKALLASLTID